MPVHLQKEIIRLKQRLFTLSATVEEAVAKAMRAVEERDPRLAAMVIQADSEIDQCEVDVEEDCLKILALHQPVARDLRLLIAFLKITNDLERIGDLAVNIAECARELSPLDPITLAADLVGSAAIARTMLRNSLDSVVNLSRDKALIVMEMDDQVDDQDRAVAREVKQRFIAEPEHIDQLLILMLVSRHIERIADLATNIAEDAIYMADGEIVRHGRSVMRGEEVSSD